MAKTIKSEIRGIEALTVFWRQYFREIPVCSHPECACVASEVDAFFPYIDDFNRCEDHPLESMQVRSRGASAGRHAAQRISSPRSGDGSRSRGSARFRWRPPR